MSTYSTDNYFEFYNLPISFSLDKKHLKQQYYRYSKELHPDYHTTSDVSVQNEMLQLSAYNNKAYKTLKDDHSRLAYIIDLFSEEGSKAMVSQDFLMEMMDINEGVMELEFDPVPEKKASILRELEQHIQSLDQEKESLFAHADALAKDSEILKAAKDLYHKFQYINRLKTNIAKL